MSDDYPAPSRSNDQIRIEARQTLKAYGGEKRWPVNIVRYMQSGWIPTRYGKKELIYKIVPDDQMGDKDGRTEFTADAVIISVKQSIHQKAVWGDGRSRMTLAHELAHGVMHFGVTQHRGAGAIGTTAYSRSDASRSAEHQAKVFASAFLIDDEVAATLPSAEDISTEFGVSLKAATICFERLTERLGRAEAIERVRQSNEAFQQHFRKNDELPRYADGACGACGLATLIPIGTKLLCQSCGHISDPD
jgi:hypothetical protein